MWAASRDTSDEPSDNVDTATGVGTGTVEPSGVNASIGNFSLARQ